MERYAPSEAVVDVEEWTRRVEAAAAPDGYARTIRHLSSTLIPADEMCLSVFEATSPAAIREAFAGADLSFERISEVHHVTSGPEGFEDVQGETSTTQRPDVAGAGRKGGTS